MATKPEFVLFLNRLHRAVPKFAPPLDETTYDVWYAELCDLTTQELSDLYRACVRGLDVFPSVKQVLELAGRGTRSDEDAAREVAERIWVAISRFGAGYWAQASEFIGPVGAEVVRSNWTSMCDNALDIHMPTLKAQWREAAAVVLRNARAGVLNRPPELPARLGHSEVPEKARELPAADLRPQDANEEDHVTARELAAIDVGTEEGREKAIERLRELRLRFAEGRRRGR